MTDDPKNVNPPLDGSDLKQSVARSPVTTEPVATTPLNIPRIVSRMRFDATTGTPISYPALKSVDDLYEWSSCLEKKFKDRGIPKARWPEAALLFLLDAKPELNLAMRKRRMERMTGFGAVGMSHIWSWEDFLSDLQEALVELNVPNAFNQFREDHPTAVKVAGTGLAVAGAAALTPVVVIGGLNALGFTAAGVAGGSVAAGLQSAIYGGATTGLFSVCQSIAATAAVPAAASIFSAAGALAVSVGLIGANETDPEGNASDHGDGAPGGPDDRQDGADPTDRQDTN